MNNQDINLHAENAVIGSLLMDNGALDEVSFLKPDDFGSPLHGDIFRAICYLISEGKSADIISVSEFLYPQDNMMFVQVCDVANSVYTKANIKHYADIVKQYSTDRKMLTVAQNIILNIHNKKENRLDIAQQSISAVTDTLSTNTMHAGEVLTSVIGIIDEGQNNPAKITGIATGFNGIDEVTHGFHSGHLTILAARPSMGKTLLAMNIAEHAAFNDGKTVLVFTLEMNKEELIERSLASLGRLDCNRIKSGQLTRQDFACISSLIPQYASTKLFLDDCSSISVFDIRSRCRRIKREYGLDLVVVDYIGLISGEGENETDRVGKISRSLKLLARDLNVPLIAVSQLNRGVEQRQDKRPTMADLRQSGAIEQDADLILFIYRDAFYNKQAQNNPITEVNIAKNRHGELGTIYLTFNSHYCRFDNYLGLPPINNSDKIVKMNHYYDL